MHGLSRILASTVLLQAAGAHLGAQKAVTPHPFRDLQRASTAVEAGELDAAERQLERLVAGAPDFAGAWFLLAQCRRLRGDARAAAKAAERAMSLDPDNLQAVVIAVEVFAEFDRARAVSLALRVAEAGGEPGMLRRVADVMLQIGQVDVARHVIDAGLAAHPEDLDLLEAEARQALAAGKPDRAIAAYEAMLSVKPAHPQALHSLARVLLVVGRRRDAAEAFERTLRVHPSDLAAREDLLRLLDELDADTERIEAHRRYLEYYRYWHEKVAGEGRRPAPSGK